MQDKQVKDLIDTSLIFKIIAYLNPILGFFIYLYFKDSFEYMLSFTRGFAIPLYIVIVCIITMRIYEKGIKYSWMASMLQKQIDINNSINKLNERNDSNESSGI